MNQNLNRSSYFKPKQHKITNTKHSETSQKEDWLQVQTFCSLIDKNYMTVMLQLYNQNKSKLPNPEEILLSLRHICQKWDRGLLGNQLCLQKPVISNLYKSSATSSTAFSDMNHVQNAKTEQKSTVGLFQKLKHKFTPFFQQYLGSSNEFLKWITVDESKIVENLYENVNLILRESSTNMRRNENFKIDELQKKYRNVQNKWEAEVKDQLDMNEKLNSKLKQMTLQNKKLIEQRKKVEREKNQIHTQVYRSHQQIIEKSRAIQDLRDHLQQCQQKLQRLESYSVQSKRVLNKMEQKQRQLQHQISILSQSLRAQKLMNQKLKKELTQTISHEQQTLNKKLTRIKSHIFIKSQSQEQDYEQTIHCLQQKIIKLQHQLRIMKETQHKRKFQKEEKQKLRMEKIVSEWKKITETIVSEMQEEIDHKSAKIYALQCQLGKGEKNGEQNCQSSLQIK